ncbi:MAG: cytidine deaminase [Armatimonadaceae bacterium]
MDKEKLTAAAVAARAQAYAPYSKYSVGAAVLAEDGRLFTGSNIENASYGLTICAERTAVFTAVSAGVRAIVAVTVATEDGGSPCGACRQVLSEFRPRNGSEMAVYLTDRGGNIVRETTLSELLPLAFDLEATTTPDAVP